MKSAAVGMMLLVIGAMVLLDRFSNLASTDYHLTTIEVFPPPGRKQMLIPLNYLEKGPPRQPPPQFVVDVRTMAHCAYSVDIVRLGPWCPPYAAEVVQDEAYDAYVRTHEGPDGFYVLVDGAERLAPFVSHLGHCRYRSTFTVYTKGPLRVTVRHYWEGWYHLQQHVHHPMTEEYVVTVFHLDCKHPTALPTLTRCLHSAEGRYVAVDAKKALKPAPRHRVHPFREPKVWTNYVLNFNGRYTYVPYGCPFPPWNVSHVRLCTAKKTVVMLGASHSFQMSTTMGNLLAGVSTNFNYDTVRKGNGPAPFIGTVPQGNLRREELSGDLRIRSVPDKVLTSYVNVSYSDVDVVLIMTGQWSMLHGTPLTEFVQRLRKAIAYIRAQKKHIGIFVVSTTPVHPYNRYKFHNMVNYNRVKWKDHRNHVALGIWNVFQNNVAKEMGVDFIDVQPFFTPMLDASYDGEHFSSTDALRYASMHVLHLLCRRFRTAAPEQ